MCQGYKSLIFQLDRKQQKNNHFSLAYSDYLVKTLYITIFQKKAVTPELGRELFFTIKCFKKSNNPEFLFGP